MNTRLFMVTGDPSGDIHAAHVARELKERDPDMEIVAVGGSALRSAGVSLLGDQSRMGQIGVAGVFSTLHHFRLGHKICRFLETFKPDAVLLIDYGGFNLRLAKHLKKRNHTVYYFIPPQVWASRRHRIETIRRHIDHVFCIFPFEETLYREQGIPVTYVGHPLAGSLPPPANREDFCRTHHLDPAGRIIAIFPGSRQMEIQYLLKPVVKAAGLLQRAMPNTLLQFVIAQSDALPDAYFQTQLSKALRSINTAHDLRLLVLKGQNYALQSVADAAIVKSGTGTLETALYRTPMVIVYKGPGLLAWIARKLCYLPCVGLPNILTDVNRPVVRELLQEAVTPENIRDAVLPLFDKTSEAYQRALAGYDEISNQMKTTQATACVALEVLKRCSATDSLACSATQG